MSYASTVATDSPVGQWRLNETSGTSAADSSGVVGATAGTYNGGFTLNDKTAPVPDGYKYATLNGTTGYVSVPATDTNILITGALTLECWVKFVGNSGYQSLISHGDATAAVTDSYALMLDNTALAMWTVIGTTLTSARLGYQVATGVWLHVVGTRTSGGAVKLYVNGMLVASASDAGTPMNTINTVGVALGRTASASNDFVNGSLAECAIYNTALSAARVLAHFQAGNTVFNSGYSAVILADSPALYCRLDDPGGIGEVDYAYDLSSNGYTGFWESGGGPSKATGVTTDGDGSASFNGSNQTCRLMAAGTTNLNSLFGSQAWSIEAWVYETATVGNYGIFGRSGDGGTGVQMELSVGFSDASNKPQVGFYNGGWRVAAWGTALSASTWYHLVGTWDGTTLTLYVNGLSKATNVPGVTPVQGPTSRDFNISLGNNGGLYFPGRIDELAVYPTALSAAQVTAHYAAGAGNFARSLNISQAVQRSAVR